MKYPQFAYNFEEISAKDIISFIEEMGHKVTPYYRDDDLRFGYIFRIENTRIAIRLPDVDNLLERNFDIFYSLSGAVKWNSSKRFYSSDEAYNADKKLYYKLKKKYEMKVGTIPQSIKDLDWVREQQKKASGIRGFISRFMN